MPTAAASAADFGALPFDDCTPAQLTAIEAETQCVGRFLFAHTQENPARFWQRRWWDERLMAWSMHDEALKVRLFRFVDVLPMLRTSKAVVGELREYLEPVYDRLPWPLKLALGTAKVFPLSRGLIAGAARLGATDMARKFIAGETMPQVVAAALVQRKLRRCFTLDLLGEAVITQSEATSHFEAYQKLLAEVAPLVARWPADPLLDADCHGPLPRLNLSIKLSALDCHFDSIDPAGTLQRVGERLKELLRLAKRCGAFLNVDMEAYDKKDLTLHIFRSVLADPEFRDETNVGIVLQCYLKETARDLLALRDWAAQRGAPVWVRLVKGAYWDHETIRAKSHGWPIPVWQQKWQSDANYERLTRFALANSQHLRVALASHNLRSLAHGIATAEKLEVPKSGFELQMLYGMADGEKQALTDLGHRLRIYMPYGNLIPGMAYLVRRLLENTSNDSFLKAGFVDQVSPDKLLQNPALNTTVLVTPPVSEPLPMPTSSPPATKPFANQPPVDFSHAENRRAMGEAIAAVEQQLPRDCPLVIGSQKVTTAENLLSQNPAERTQIVGRVALASAAHVQQAVELSQQALAGWNALGASERGKILQTAAEMMRERLFELAAWEVLEVGKNWREATADVDEAIDFLEYYAREAVELMQPTAVDVAGEENRLDYLPRGVTAVIAPWNFPLAILTGMAAAALATGNTVVLKPAEQSPVMGSLLMEILAAAGVPANVLQFLPGKGEVTGAALVEHPDVATIVFTGSQSVGLAIHAQAAAISARGSRQVKKVIAEMGGKNAIIVAADADLDEAVLGVTHSAFGFQGQKCSACSRVIVLSDIYETFLERLVAATASLPIGLPRDPAATFGPVIDEEALANVQKYIALGRKEGREVLAMSVGALAEQGSFVGPHIFTDVLPTARIAQEEIFGPVLAVIKANDLTEALAIANGTKYALTGGIYSRSPLTLERARREFLVGNLYLNRPITGALVQRQPFGGFGMSGIGSKAGGKDYLRQFVVPRTVTEHTVRRGFAPS